MPFLVALTALCLTITSVTSCHFVLSESTDYGAVTFGLFRYGEDSNGVCSTFRHQFAATKNFNNNNNNIDDDTPDREGRSAAHAAAQAGGILACLFGFVCVILLLLSFSCKRLVSKAVWRIVLPILFFLAFLTQVMTFAVFGDDLCQEECVREGQGAVKECSVVTCSFSQGANRSFAAMILYLALGVGIIFFPRREGPLFKLVADQDDNADHNTTAISNYEVAVDTEDKDATTEDKDATDEV